VVVKRPRWEYGYRYTDWREGAVKGPVPEWEARGRALLDYSVEVQRRAVDGEWAPEPSPNPDDFQRFLDSES